MTKTRSRYSTVRINSETHDKLKLAQRQLKREASHAWNANAEHTCPFVDIWKAGTHGLSLSETLEVLLRENKRLRIKAGEDAPDLNQPGNLFGS